MPSTSGPRRKRAIAGPDRIAEQLAEMQEEDLDRAAGQAAPPFEGSLRQVALGGGSLGIALLAGLAVDAGLAGAAGFVGLDAGELTGSPPSRWIGNGGVEPCRSNRLRLLPCERSLRVLLRRALTVSEGIDPALSR